MHSPDHKSTSVHKAVSPTSTKSSNESEAEGDPVAMLNSKSLLNRRVAGGLALLLLLGAAAGMIVVFVVQGNSNGQRGEGGLLRSSNAVAPPTLPPTKAPSPEPSSGPTKAPSSSPSGEPSVKPSSAPSRLPSLQPSSKPSPKPSSQPTITPTKSPTFFPTASPTRELVPPGFYFRLKMYWDDFFFWQETWTEYYWCAECTTCEQLTTSGSGEGCRDSDRGSRHDCEDGDLLWTQNCDGKGNDIYGSQRGEGNAQFELLRTHPEADQLKIRGKDLCLERASNRHIHLKPCDSSEIRQLWLGFRLDGQPFELRPLEQNFRPNQYDDPVETERCISQHHHPKAGEVLYLEECERASTWNTILWEMY